MELNDTTPILDEAAPGRLRRHRRLAAAGAFGLASILALGACGDDDEGVVDDDVEQEGEDVGDETGELVEDTGDAIEEDTDDMNDDDDE